MRLGRGTVSTNGRADEPSPSIHPELWVGAPLEAVAAYEATFA
jgi:hypothetical protein